MGLISPGGENLLDFLELRHMLSTYDGDLRDPLWWPWGNNFPFYNSQHDSDICQLAKHFHMCISGASEQPCEQNPHRHPLEAEDREEEAEETEQASECPL